jgi:hypothetical protein
MALKEELANDNDHSWRPSNRRFPRQHTANRRHSVSYRRREVSQQEQGTRFDPRHERV